MSIQKRLKSSFMVFTSQISMKLIVSKNNFINLVSNMGAPSYTVNVAIDGIDNWSTGEHPISSSSRHLTSKCQMHFIYIERTWVYFSILQTAASRHHQEEIKACPLWICVHRFLSSVGSQFVLNRHSALWTGWAHKIFPWLHQRKLNAFAELMSSPERSAGVASKLR